MTRAIISTALALAFAWHAPAQAPTVRDSSGVRIVENPSIANAKIRFRLAAKPDIVVGGLRDKPEDELNQKISYPEAMQAPGNRLIVADGDQLKLFDATGHLLARMGRNGAGPGEFRNTQSLCRMRGDSILAWDVSNRRISIWSIDGKLGREFTPPAFAYGGGCLGDGSIIADGTRLDSPRDDLPLSRYVVVSGTGAVAATTGSLPRTLYAGGVMREVKIKGVGDHFYFGDGIELGFRVLDRTGKVIRVVRTKDSPDPVTDATLSTRSMGCTPNRATGVCTPLPTTAKTWPAFYGFGVDEGGRVWERLNHGGEDSVWIAFDSTGKISGKLVMPPHEKTARPRIVRFGKDEVVLTDFDADGARRYSVYKLLAVP